MLANEKLKHLRNLSKDYSLFGWIKFVYKTSDKQVFSLCNAEGFMYLYFLRTTGYLLLVISIISIVVFIPLFSVKQDTNDDVSIIHKLTVKNAYDNFTKLVIVLIFSFLYTFLAYYHVYNYKKKLNIVQQKIQTEDSLDSDIALHTIHIRNINKKLSYFDAKKILDSFFEVSFLDQIIEIHVIPDNNRLMNLIDQKSHVEAKYNKFKALNETNITKRYKIKVDMTEKVDAEIYYKNKSKIIDNLIIFYRKLNSKKNTGNAFVSFKSQKTVEKILKDKENLIYSKKDTFHGQLLNIKDWSISLAPPPSDLIWNNIKYSKKYRIIKMIILTVTLFCICLVIITPHNVKCIFKII